MLKDFNQSCKEKEVTKSEILRNCIGKFIEEKIMCFNDEIEEVTVATHWRDFIKKNTSTNNPNYLKELLNEKLNEFRDITDFDNDKDYENFVKESIEIIEKHLKTPNNTDGKLFI